MDPNSDMTNRFTQSKGHAPRQTWVKPRMDGALIGAWGASVLARETLISTKFDPNLVNSTFLTPLHGLDQTLGKSPEWALLFDRASDLGQALMAALVIFAPWWLESPGSAESQSGRSLLPNSLRLFRAAAINGVILEWVRVAVQRPRPYVAEKILNITAPLTVSDFTSFYSGHTSFSFAALATLTWAAREKVGSLQNPSPYSKQKQIVLLTLGLTIASATGIMRVYAGRHHISDVLTGAVMGLLCGLIAKKLSTRIEPI